METLCYLQIPYFNEYVKGYSFFSCSGVIVENKQDTVSVKITNGYKKGNTLVVSKDCIIDLVTVNLN